MDSIIVCTTRTVSCSRDVDLTSINFLATNEAILGRGRRVKLPSDWTPAFCTRIQPATITGAYAGHCSDSASSLPSAPSYSPNAICDLFIFDAVHRTRWMMDGPTSRPADMLSC